MFFDTRPDKKPLSVSLMLKFTRGRQTIVMNVDKPGLIYQIAGDPDEAATTDSDGGVASHKRLMNLARTRFDAPDDALSLMEERGQDHEFVAYDTSIKPKRDKMEQLRSTTFTDASFMEYGFKSVTANFVPRMNTVVFVTKKKKAGADVVFPALFRQTNMFMSVIEPLHARYEVYDIDTYMQHHRIFVCPFLADVVFDIPIFNDWDNNSRLQRSLLTVQRTTQHDDGDDDDDDSYEEEDDDEEVERRQKQRGGKKKKEKPTLSESPSLLATYMLARSSKDRGSLSASKYAIINEVVPYVFGDVTFYAVGIGHYTSERTPAGKFEVGYSTGAIEQFVHKAESAEAAMAEAASQQQQDLDLLNLMDVDDILEGVPLDDEFMSMISTAAPSDFPELPVHAQSLSGGGSAGPLLPGHSHASLPSSSSSSSEQRRRRLREIRFRDMDTVYEAALLAYKYCMPLEVDDS